MILYLTCLTWCNLSEESLIGHDFCQASGRRLNSPGEASGPFIIGIETMGRIFEKRKYKMFARFARMSKAFTKIGKEIAVAVRLGGPDPDNNPRLRMAIQMAKTVNMPKDRIEAAIRRASNKEDKDLEEIVYEAYGPHGIALMIECATDNPTRTVANIRHLLSKNGGSLGTTNSVAFMFERKGVFRISTEGRDPEELELELIDLGAEEIETGEDEAVVYTRFEDYAAMQKGLEQKNIHVLSADIQRIPSASTELNDDKAGEVQGLLDKLDEDDDVQAVFHNMK